MKSPLKNVLKSVVAMHLLMKVIIIMIFAGNNIMARAVVVGEKKKTGIFVFENTR